jgi:hypothetical protein
MEYAYRVWHTKKQVPTFNAGFSIAGAQNFKKKKFGFKLEISP